MPPIFKVAKTALEMACVVSTKNSNDFYLVQVFAKIILGAKEFQDGFIF